MLTIRLIKTGRKNSSSFRVILIENTAAPQSGKFLEILGNYNPHNKEINFKEERIKYWLSQGVKTSETVHNLLVKKGLIEGPKIKRNIKKKKKKSSSGDEQKPEVKEEIKEEIKEVKEEIEEKE